MREAPPSLPTTTGVEESGSSTPLRAKSGVPRRLGVYAIAAPAAIFAASRVVTLLAFSVAAELGHLSFARVAGAWDGAWYIETARSGYPHVIPANAKSTLAFFPLFPGIIRAVVYVTGVSYLTAGLLVSFVCGLGAAVLLWRLFSRLAGPDTANRACAIFCFFPGAFVLSMVYAEGLELMLAIGCLLALLSRRWWIAGILAALATAAHSDALVLVGCCAWAAAAEIRHERRWVALVAPLLAPAGFLGFCAFLWRRTGSVTAWFHVEGRGWGERLDPGAYWSRIIEFIHHPFVYPNTTATLAGLIFAVVAGVLLVRSRSPAILLIYAFGVAGLALLSKTIGLRPRLLLTAFPLVTVIGQRFRGTSFAVALSVSAALLALLTVVSLSSLVLTP